MVDSKGVTDKKQTHVERVETSEAWRWLGLCLGGALGVDAYSSTARNMLRDLAAKLDAAEAELARRDAAAAEAQRTEEERATTDIGGLCDALLRALKAIGARGSVQRNGDVTAFVFMRYDPDGYNTLTWQRTYRIGATEAQIAADLRAALKALEGMS